MKHVIKSNILENQNNIKHGFFCRLGGTSPHPYQSLNTGYHVGDIEPRVTENRSRIKYYFSQNFKTKIITASQTHSSKVLRIDSNSIPKEILETEADALWTTDKNIILGVLTADCAPILISNKKKSHNSEDIIAAVHAGWRGCVGGIIQACIKDICKQTNNKPEDLLAAIGPCADIKNYEVGEEVIDQVLVSIPGALETNSDIFIKNDNSSNFKLGLNNLAEAILIKSGLNKNNIDNLNVSTLVNKDYFSHRRDAKQFGRTGRQMSAIILK